MFFPDTPPAATVRLPLRPSPGPEPLPEPPPGLSWEHVLLALALVGLSALLWRCFRRRSTPAPSPQAIALAALERTTARFEADPIAAFIETADILRRYWTATGIAPAESHTTAELMALLPTLVLPSDIDRDALAHALQQADQLKFAGTAVTAAEARQWGERVKGLLEAPAGEQKTASG